MFCQVNNVELNKDTHNKILAHYFFLPEFERFRAFFKQTFEKFQAKLPIASTLCQFKLKHPVSCKVQI